MRMQLDWSSLVLNLKLTELTLKLQLHCYVFLMLIFTKIEVDIHDKETKKEGGRKASDVISDCK